MGVASGKLVEVPTTFVVLAGDRVFRAKSSTESASTWDTLTKGVSKLYFILTELKVFSSTSGRPTAICGYLRTSSS